MLRTEFYAAFAPGDDRGTVRYHDQRHRGLHQAAFTYEEWQQIRSITQSMARAPQRQTQAKRFYEFAGYVADIHCGLPLRAQGKSTTTDYEYYRDTARERRIPCPAGGHLMLRSDLVRAQFGEMLKNLILPDNWREEIRRQMIAEAQAQGTMMRMDMSNSGTGASLVRMDWLEKRSPRGYTRNTQDRIPGDGALTVFHHLPAGIVNWVHN